MTSLFDDKGAAKLLAFSGDKPDEWRSWKSKFEAMLDGKDLLVFLLSNDVRPAEPGPDQTPMTTTTASSSLNSTWGLLGLHFCW